MNLDTAIQNLSADIARRAIEDAIGVVNRAFDGLKVVHRAAPVAPAKARRSSRVPRRDFRAGTLRERIAAIASAEPMATNREVAARLGLKDGPAFNDAMSVVRRKLGLPNRPTRCDRNPLKSDGSPNRHGRPFDPSSKFGRLRVALESNPTATNHEIAAIVGVPYTLNLSSHCYRLRKALGIPSPRGPGREASAS